MASISEYLNKVINAVYGRDVRKAIHDAIKQVYDDASKNGNANMEVTFARDTEPTLTDRLNRDYEYLNMLIISLSSGGPKELFYSVNALKNAYPKGADYTVLVFDSFYMDGAHTFIWTGTEWKDVGVYQGLEIPEESVGYKELSPDVSGIDNTTTAAIVDNGKIVGFKEVKNGSVVNSVRYEKNTDGSVTVTETKGEFTVKETLSRESNGNPRIVKEVQA